MHSPSLAPEPPAVPTAGLASSLRRSHPALGTSVDIHLAGLHPVRLARVLVAARRELNRCERILSAHRPDNDLARLREAGPGAVLEIDVRTAVVLRRAAALARASAGAFDPRRRFTPGAPSFAASFRLLPGRRIRLSAPLDLDLGGIARGHALDRAATILRRGGVPSFSLNAGGDLRIQGLVTRLLLRPSRAGSGFLQLGVLREGAAASFARGDRDHPGSTVRPGTRSLGVTVLAPSAIDADALAKAVALAPQAPATARLLARRHAHAALAEPDGTLRWLPAPPPARILTPVSSMSCLVSQS